MKSYIKPVSVVSEIRMNRRVEPDVGYLLVEGEADEKFFRNLVNHDKCKVKEIRGKGNVLSNMKALNIQHIKGVLAIVDSDFDMFLDDVEYIENVIKTDTHDIETLILKTYDISRILYEYSSVDKMNQFKTVYGTNVLDKVIDICAGIGKLRFLSLKQKLDLGFKDLIYNNLVTEKLELNCSELMRQVACNSNLRGARKEEIAEKFNVEITKSYDVWNICCGHDITQVLALFLNKNEIGNKSGQQLNMSKVEAALRLSYSYLEFYKTNMYETVIEWQKTSKWVLFYNSCLEEAS